MRRIFDWVIGAASVAGLGKLFKVLFGKSFDELVFGTVGDWLRDKVGEMTADQITYWTAALGPYFVAGLIVVAVAWFFFREGRRSAANNSNNALKISFEPRSPWVHWLYGNVPVPIETRPTVSGSSVVATRFLRGERNAKCIFVRFEVSAINGTVKNCRVLLKNIEKLDGNEWHQTNFGSSLELRWVETQDYSPIDIQKEGRHFADLFSTDEIFKQVLVKWKRKFISNEGIFRFPGTYKLTVVCIPEEGDAAQAEFILVWRGLWDDFDIQIVGGEKRQITWHEEST